MWRASTKHCSTSASAPCSASRRWMTPTQSCPLPRACPLPWSICPASSTSAPHSAAECIQLISQGERPLVRSARVYLLDGTSDRSRAGGRDQEVRHQPGGGPRGFAGARDPEDGVPRARARGECWRASPSWTRQALPVHRGKGPCHGPGRISSSARSTSATKSSATPPSPRSR